MISSKSFSFLARLRLYGEKAEDDLYRRLFGVLKQGEHISWVQVRWFFLV